ncbi:Hypothetical predicted protein [Octopus vulgaris]|uniref:Uncharacterized protein n=1 Tax=Octopus vulgaris TaxID=6645 RepID=A0AA36BMQ5_OCTVU|nr:Hypothetical predicted protein [Octopus vulgaris]
MMAMAVAVTDGGDVVEGVGCGDSGDGDVRNIVYDDGGVSADGRTQDAVGSIYLSDPCRDCGEREMVVVEGIGGMCVGVVGDGGGCGCSFGGSFKV